MKKRDARSFHLVRVIPAILSSLAINAFPISPGVVVTSTADSGGGSLRQALINVVPGNMITFDASLSGQTIVLTSGQLTVSNNVTIDASTLPDGITINGNATSRILYINAGATCTVSHVTLANGSTSGDGGGILNDGMLTINSCTIRDCFASQWGGGIEINGVCEANNSTLFGNSCNGAGAGAIDINGATAVLNQCTLSGNSSSDPGGAGGIYNAGGSLTANNTIIAGNTSPGGYPNLNGAINAGTDNLVDAAPVLAPPGNYGGPTQTMPPLSGSPAIDAGGATLFATDQRGAPRFDLFPDIGAVESQSIVRNSDDDGPGSLRATFPWAPENETITFDPTLSGQSIVLTSGQLTVDKNLDIDASTLPDGITIDGNSSNRIFQVESGATCTFSHVTLANGSTGGNGGGILNYGMLTINSSTIRDCFAISYGGGIENENILEANNCTFVGNSCNSAGGGAIDLDQGTAVLNQCTISGNLTTSSSGGGGIYNNAGISSLTANNTIVAGNSSPGSYPNLFGVINAGVNNLVDVDPLLAPLGDYGGPTQTMPPFPGSPAIDAGDNAAAGPFSSDQRGFPRIVDSTVDIGAVESDGLMVNTTVDENDGVLANDISLRDAIDFVPPANRIVFRPDLSGGTIMLSHGELVVSNNLSIDTANLPDGLTIDGNAGSRIFNIAYGTTCTVSRVTVANGAVSGDGGGIYVWGTLTLNSCTIANSFASRYGGGIENEGVLMANNCTLFGNSCDSVGGGAIDIAAGSVFLEQCTLSGNSSSDPGGAGGIYKFGVTTFLAVYDSIVAGNTSPGSYPNLLGGINSAASNLVDTVPLLAPPGDYGGPTQTMPPLPGSPAIDAGDETGLTTDQRGFPRTVGIVDIGAVEIQDPGDSGSIIAAAWPNDNDGDGNPFGVEFALGTDWLNPDGTNAANLSIVVSNGVSGASFGFNPAASNTTAWVLLRSLDLVSDTFVEIYRYDGPTGSTSNAVPVTIFESPDSIMVFDESVPQPINAFYLFAAELSSP